MDPKPERVTRRKAIASLVVLPALAGAMTAQSLAYTKASKEQLEYQASPHGSERCSNCRVFHPGKTADAFGTCSLVAGSISPNGWCRVFVAKSK